MTHEEQIKWMADRIAHLETQYESAMEMVATLMGKLKPLTEQAVEAEREACAKIIDDSYETTTPCQGIPEDWLLTLSEAIRARGQA